MRHLLILTCLFTLAAGTWLGVMENILKHPGYAGRSVIAAGIIIQSSATVIFIILSGSSALRNMVLIGAIAIGLLGAWATMKILRAQHFEGYVLVIGAALITQGFLTLAALLQSPKRNLA